MAKKGLSRLFMAKYSYDPTSGATYSDGVENEKLASYSTEISNSEESKLYLNNGVAESEGGRFVSGTLTITTGDLMPNTSEMICGIKKKSIKIEGIEEDLEEMIYDETAKPSDLGVGFIELHQVDGVEFHRAIVLAKVSFNVPSDSANTKGESVEWQTQEIPGTIKRSDEANEENVHPWKFSADCPSEEIAVKYIKHKLNISDLAKKVANKGA